MSKMPILLNVDHLLQSLETQEERDIVVAIIGNQNRLRSSKPKLDSDINRLAAYVWRMVAFQISPNRQHHCMPMTADFDMPQEYWGQGNHDKRRAKTKELDILVEKIVNTVPKEQWYGVTRWGKAFGVL